MAEADGPQVVTRHGLEVVVVLTVEEYHRLRGDVPDFKQFLMSGPDLSDLDIRRDPSPPRTINLPEGSPPSEQ